MPPMLYGHLRKDTIYQVVKVNNGKVELLEVSAGFSHRISTPSEQLMNEIKGNSVILI